MSGSFEILTDNTISIFKEGNRVATFKDIDEILQCKKDSAEWKIYMDGGMNYLFEIHERLKKELKNYESIKSTGDDTYDEGTKEVINLLEKIRGENK